MKCNIRSECESNTWQEDLVSWTHDYAKNLVRPFGELSESAMSDLSLLLLSLFEFNPLIPILLSGQASPEIEENQIILEDTLETGYLRDTRSHTKKRKILSEQAVREGQLKLKENMIIKRGLLVDPNFNLIRCMLSGNAYHTGIVEAAHIDPYWGPRSNALQNGLLLRIDLHRLFDKHLMTIIPGKDGITYTAKFHPCLLAFTPEYCSLEGKTLVYRKLNFSDKQQFSKEALKDHNGLFEAKIEEHNCQNIRNECEPANLRRNPVNSNCSKIWILPIIEDKIIGIDVITSTPLLKDLQVGENRYQLLLSKNTIKHQYYGHFEKRKLPAPNFETDIHLPTHGFKLVLSREKLFKDVEINKNNVNQVFSELAKFFRILFMGDIGLSTILAKYHSNEIYCCDNIGYDLGFCLTDPQIDAVYYGSKSVELENSIGFVNSLNVGHRAALLALPTGMGKTVCAAICYHEFLHNYPRTKLLFLAEQVEHLSGAWNLLSRVLSKCESCSHLIKKSSFICGYQPSASSLGKNINKYITDKFDKSRIVFATRSSMADIYTKLPANHFDLIIVDEAHHVGANDRKNLNMGGEYRRILSHFQPLGKKKGARYLLGLTATPFRSDEIKVSNLFTKEGFDPSGMGNGNIIYQYSKRPGADVSKGVAEGYLSWIQWRTIANISESKHLAAGLSKADNLHAQQLENKFKNYKAQIENMKATVNNEGWVELLDFSDDYCELQLNIGESCDIAIKEIKVGDGWKQACLDCAAKYLEVSKDSSELDKLNSNRALRLKVNAFYQEYRALSKKHRMNFKAVVYCGTKIRAALEISNFLTQRAMEDDFHECLSLPYVSKDIPNKDIFNLETIRSEQSLLSAAEALDKFKEGKVSILCALSKMDEGLDIPEINMIVFFKETASIVKKIQRLGRGLRLSPGKRFTYVLDFQSNFHNLYQLLDEGYDLTQGKENESRTIQDQDAEQSSRIINAEKDQQLSLNLRSTGVIYGVTSETIKFLELIRNKGNHSGIDFGNDVIFKPDEIDTARVLRNQGYSLGEILNKLSLKDKVYSLQYHNLLDCLLDQTFITDEAARRKYITEILYIKLVYAVLGLYKSCYGWWPDSKKSFDANKKLPIINKEDLSGNAWQEYLKIWKHGRSFFEKLKMGSLTYNKLLEELEGFITVALVDTEKFRILYEFWNDIVALEKLLSVIPSNKRCSFESLFQGPLISISYFSYFTYLDSSGLEKRFQEYYPKNYLGLLAMLKMPTETGLANRERFCLDKLNVSKMKHKIKRKPKPRF